MELRYLLDTDICIYINRKRPQQVRKHFERLRPGEAAISVITFGELLYGAAKSAKRIAALHDLEDLKHLLQVLPMGEEVADAYGAIRATLESRGKPIGNNDLWIAAHAVSARLILVTNNEKEFSRVTGLKIQNWAN